MSSVTFGHVISNGRPRHQASADPATPASQAPSLTNTEEDGFFSSVLTTPKFAGQTSPTIPLDYSPTRATGKELEDRKDGIYLRPRAGDDNDAY